MPHKIYHKAVDDYHDSNVGEEVRYVTRDGRELTATVERHNPNTGRVEIRLSEPIIIGER